MYDFSQNVQHLAAHNNYHRLVDSIKHVGDDILDYMEQLGGHTLSRHVSQTNNMLRKRLKTTKKISGASSFYNKRIATKATKDVLRKNAERIADWLESKPHEVYLTLKLSHGHPIGHGMLPKSSKLIPNLTQSIAALEKDKKSELGFKIITIYPKIE